MGAGEHLPGRLIGSGAPVSEAASNAARSPRRLRARLLWSGLIFLAGILLAEALVRGFVRRRAPLTEAAGRSLVQPSADPRLRFENRPGDRQVLRYFDPEGGVSKEVEAAINADGYRGPVVAKEKPPDVIRIVAIGDSQTFGTGVAEGETWPAVLRSTLQKSLPEARVEVLNCAVQGYDAPQSAAALESRWLAYAPDLVLYGYFVNDPPQSDPRADECRTDEGRADEGRTWSRWMLGCLNRSQRGALGWARRRSALLDVVLDRIQRRLIVHEWATGAIQLHADSSEGWQRTQALFAEERDASARAGARFGIVLLPFLVRFGEGWISTEPYKKVAAACASAGIPAFDPEPCFAGEDPAGMLVHERDAHTSAKAQRIEGEAIARWVLEQKLLRERSCPGR